MVRTVQATYSPTMTRKLLSPLLLLILTLGLAANAHAASGGYTEGKPNYIALDPAIVVNLAAGRRMKFMQVKVQAMTKSVEMAETIEANKPAIRHELLMLLTHQDTATMSDVQAREKVRAEALTVVQQLIYELTGVGEAPAGAENAESKKPKKAEEDEDEKEASAPVRIEAIYFTDFIIQ